MEKEEFIHRIRKATIPLPGSIPEPVQYKLSVKKKYEGWDILSFFLDAVPNSKKEVWKQKIKNQNLTVNNKTINESYLVKAGDITSHFSDPKIEPDINPKIDLIYEDESILVINKPAPLPVHASGRFVRNTLINILNAAFPNENFRLLHRLDANTTGVTILAKTKEIANEMRLIFENQEVKKIYYALVEGLVDETTSKAEAKIGKEVMSAGGRVLNEFGKPALTHISVEQFYPDQNTTLLKLRPETGRTNQIRLHLAHLGHPIVGDIGHKNPEYFKHNPFTYPEDSLFLHAAELSFVHPDTKSQVVFKAPLPAKFST